MSRIGVSSGRLALGVLGVFLIAPRPGSSQIPESPCLDWASLEILLTCAESGDAWAQNNLGLMYAWGEGVPRDDAEAVRWIQLAAEQGFAEAQNNLGLMYDQGTGVPEDDAEAVRWYRLAAEQGNAFAQLNLGVMYGTGQGAPEDLVYAYMWYNLAAAQGNETAQSNKEIIVRRMTREQIAEAQRLSREWIETHPQDGGN